MHAYVHEAISSGPKNMRMFVHVCVYVYVYLCVYLCKYTYTRKHAYTSNCMPLMCNAIFEEATNIQKQSQNLRNITRGCLYAFFWQTFMFCFKYGREWQSMRGQHLHLAPIRSFSVCFPGAPSLPLEPFAPALSPFSFLPFLTKFSTSWDAKFAEWNQACHTIRMSFHTYFVAQTSKIVWMYGIGTLHLCHTHTHQIQIYTL